MDSVYTDYSKVFENISYDLLLCKLGEIGIRGGLLCWVENYLRKRTQAVIIKGFSSLFIPVTLGVVVVGVPISDFYCFICSSTILSPKVF